LRIDNVSFANLGFYQGNAQNFEPIVQSKSVEDVKKSPQKNEFQWGEPTNFNFSESKKISPMKKELPGIFANKIKPAENGQENQAVEIPKSEQKPAQKKQDLFDLTFGDIENKGKEEKKPNLVDILGENKTETKAEVKKEEKVKDLLDF